MVRVQTPYISPHFSPVMPPGKGQHLSDGEHKPSNTFLLHENSRGSMHTPTTALHEARVDPEPETKVNERGERRRAMKRMMGKGR